MTSDFEQEIDLDIIYWKGAIFQSILDVSSFIITKLTHKQGRGLKEQIYVLSIKQKDSSIETYSKDKKGDIFLLGFLSFFSFISILLYSRKISSIKRGID